MDDFRLSTFNKKLLHEWIQGSYSRLI